MCIAIVKPAGKSVSRERLSNSFIANPSGAGYAFVKDGKVVIKKGFFTFEEFYKNYSVDVTDDVVALAHFRIITRGPKNEANCHPFAIDHGALMHNGPCLNYKHCDGDKDRSDSRQFAEDFVKTYTYEMTKLALPLIAGFAGTEKVAFLFDNGEYLIANEKEGQWSEGCWYSNSSFREYSQSSYSGGNRSYTHGNAHSGSPYATSGAKGGTSTYVPPESLRQKVIKRTFGQSTELFDARWSSRLGSFAPLKIVVDRIEMAWDELYSGYIPTSATNALSTDKRYIYEQTDVAAERTKGGKPDYTIDMDWVIVGDVLSNEHDLRVFLVGAKNVPHVYLPGDAPGSQTPASGPATTPVVASVATKTEAPATTSTAADASAAPASETVH